MGNRASSVPPWEALHHIPPDADSLLDVGCNVGENLGYALELGLSRLHGVDINPDAVGRAKERLIGAAACDIRRGSADRLPFADKSFDAVICLEVLEHVPEAARPAVVAEIHRVLKPGGRFILTVPYRGVAAVLDPANMRFRFPRLFRAVSALAGGAGRDAGYAGQEHGVVWHHHFRLEELTHLLGSGFRILETRYRGAFLTPLGEWLLFPLYRRGAVHHPVFSAVKRLQRLEMAVPLPPALAYDVLVAAEKR